MTARMTADREQQIVREFMASGGPGYFVDVGANHPHNGSQTWLLEQCGWRGVLVEPIPVLAEQLRKVRTSRVFNVACSSPDNAGQTLPFHVANDTALSSLDRDRMMPKAQVQTIIDIPVRTLDSILTEAEAPCPIDFLSVDVEGHETEVLSGFDFARWAPRLILMEDHVGNLRRHRFMKSHDYRLVRRTGSNGWYMPVDSAVSFGWAEKLRLLRRYYLDLPARKVRHYLFGAAKHYTY